MYGLVEVYIESNKCNNCKGDRTSGSLSLSLICRQFLMMNGSLFLILGRGRALYVEYVVQVIKKPSKPCLGGNVHLSCSDSYFYLF